MAAKVLALLAIFWLAAASGKEKRGPNLRIPKKLKPESKKRVKIPDWDDIAKNRTNSEDGEDFRGGGGMMIGRTCNCQKVIWGTHHLQNINNKCSQTCQYWWLNGQRDTRKVMIIKVVVSTKLVFYFRVKSDSTQLQWCQAKKRKKKYVCLSRWQTVLLVKIDKYLYSSIIQWQSESAKLWGFVNPSNGMITCFGYPNELTYFINRMFINYLIKTYVIGQKGLVVEEYILWWHNKWQKFTVPEPGMWLIPTWLPMVQRVMHWRVVIYQSITYVEYIGPNLNEDIMEIWIWTNKGLYRFRVKIDTIYIYWQTRSKGQWKETWTKVLLNDLYEKLGLTIVRWKTFSGEWMTGLCNSNGDIIAFMDDFMVLYRLTINRLFLQNFILKLIDKGYTIRRYKIIWEGRVLIKSKKIVVTELLIPIWLPPEQCRVVWKVIKYESKVVIIYIGGEVSGPAVIDCSVYEDKVKCEEATKTPGQVIVPEIVFPTPPKVPESCGLFNENGRCVDVIQPDGYCRCTERCTCVDPFDRRNLGWGDPIFPGPLIPGGIIRGSCGGPSCPGPGWTAPGLPLGVMAGAAMIDSPNMTPVGGGGGVLISP